LPERPEVPRSPPAAPFQLRGNAHCRGADPFRQCVQQGPLLLEKRPLIRCRPFFKITDGHFANGLIVHEDPGRLPPLGDLESPALECLVLVEDACARDLRILPGTGQEVDQVPQQVFHRIRMPFRQPCDPVQAVQFLDPLPKGQHDLGGFHFIVKGDSPEAKEVLARA